MKPPLTVTVLFVLIIIFTDHTTPTNIDHDFRGNDVNLFHTVSHFGGSLQEDDSMTSMNENSLANRHILKENDDNGLFMEYLTNTRYKRSSTHRRQGRRNLHKTRHPKVHRLTGPWTYATRSGRPGRIRMGK